MRQHMATAMHLLGLEFNFRLKKNMMRPFKIIIKPGYLVCHRAGGISLVYMSRKKEDQEILT